jgi:hypothetical protein
MAARRGFWASQKDWSDQAGSISAPLDRERLERGGVQVQCLVLAVSGSICASGRLAWYQK